MRSKIFKMNKLKEDLQACLSDIKSTKITARKNGCEELLELLHRNEIVDFINDVSSNNPESDVSWNELFITCHNNLIQEVKSKKTSTSHARILLASSAISTIVKKASAGQDKSHVSFDKLLDASLYVLEDENIRDEIGSTYVNLLRRNILAVQKCWSRIKLEQWKDLFELGKKLFIKPLPNFGISNVIEMLTLTVKYGCEHSSFTVFIKTTRIFSFLEELLNKTMLTRDVEFHYHTFSLLVIVCQKLQKECRMAICKFGENVFDKIMNMYEAKIGGASKKTQKIIDFLLIVVEAHHPNGVTEDSEKAYAHDWDRWKRILKQLNYASLKEITRIHKFGKDTPMANNLLRLIVEVFNQIFRSNCMSVDVTYGFSMNESNFETGSNKKRRIACGFSDIMEYLNEFSNPVDMSPGLMVISSLISKYPSLVNVTDYMLLLQTMSKFLLSSKEPEVTDNLFRCCISLIDIRKKLNFDKNVIPDEEATWTSIWDALLRTIGLNQNLEWSHALLRHMIEHMWKPSMGNVVLRLYLSSVLRFSKHSLLTLLHLRERILFPNSVLDISVYSSLLRWLIPVNEFSTNIFNFSKLPLDLYARTIFLVCLKNNVKNIYESVSSLNVETELHFQNSISVSDIYALNSYDSEILLRSAHILNTHVAERNSESYVLNDDSWDYLMNLLEESTQSLLEKKESLDKLTFLQHLISYVILLLHIWKFKELSKINTDPIKIKIILNKIVTEFVAVTESTIIAERNPETMIKYLVSLSEFFRQLGIIPLKIVEDVLETTFTLLQNVFDLFQKGIENHEKNDEIESEKISDAEHISLFDAKILSHNDQVRIEACKVLIYYSYNYHETNHTQQKILNEVLENLLLKKDEEDCQQNNPVILQMAVYAVVTALKISKLDADYFINLTCVIQTLCKTDEWCAAEESAIAILKLIQRGIQNAPTECVEAWENLKILLNGMCVLLEKGGSLPKIEIIHALAFFTKTEIGEHCLRYIDDEPSLVCEDIFEYLQHSSHEVRMNAVSFLSRIFETVDLFLSNGVNLNVERIIEKFTVALFKLFTVDAPTEEEVDETVNRPLTVLYSLACAISSSKVARRKMIFLFFYIVQEKRIKQDLARKTLEMVKNHLKLNSVMDLIEDNFMYVALSWQKKYHSFQNFPFQIICDSAKQFYELLLKDIVVVLLFNGKMNELEIVSTSLDCSFCDLCKTCFCEIIAVILIKLAIDSSLVQEVEMQAHDINNLMLKTIGDDVYQKLIQMRLPDIVVCILRHLHDPFFGIPEHSILPERTVFDINRNQVEETISYFKSAAGVEDPSLAVYIAQDTPKQIQEIFQHLYVNVMKAFTSEVKLQSFQRYSLFCHFLLPYYRNLADCRMIVFIAKTMLHNLLNFISDDLNHLPVSLSAINFFEEFIAQWISDRDDQQEATSVIKEYLNIIVEKFILFASRSDSLGSASLDILRRLLVDQYDCLSESIEKLHQFPDSHNFDHFRTCLIQMQETLTDDSSLISEIERFLNAVKYSPNSPCLVESLKYLRKQLSMSKDELYTNYKNSVSEFRFSENCVDSITHRLVVTLLQIINLRDEKVAYEAICCLGEIGLINLHTLVLQYNYDNYQPNSDPEIYIIKYICRTVKDFTSDRNVEIVKTSSRVLYRTLLTTKGRIVASDSLSDAEKLFLFPYIATSVENTSERNVWSYFQLQQFKEKVNDEFLWIPVDDSSHDKWITNLVCAILSSFHEKCFLNIIQPICRLKVSFAENIFKYLVHLLMKYQSSELKQILSQRINQFFENYFTSNRCESPTDSYSLISTPEKKENAIFCNKSSIKCLLDVVHYIRLRQEEPHMNDLEINYLYAAKSAQYTSAYFTSVLYCEFWINSHFKNNDVRNDGNIASTLEDIGNASASDLNELLNTLRESFSKIGDSDALYGCGSSLLVHPETRITHYRQIGDWRRVMEFCDIQLNLNPNSYTKINDFSSAIDLAGFTYLQHHYLSSLDQPNLQLKEQFYENGWKLGKWDLNEPADNEKTFSFFHYTALKNIHESHFDGARINVMNARRSLIPPVSEVCLESSRNLYNVLSKIHCLQDIEDILTIDPSELTEKWKERSVLNSSLKFDYRSVILNQRIRTVDTRSVAGKYFILNMAKKARRSLNFSYADLCLTLIKSKDIYESNNFESKVLLEEARLLWARGEKYIARHLIKEVKKKLNITDEFRSVVLRTHGKWLSESNLENADTIFEEYFLPSVEIMSQNKLETEKTRKNRAKTYKYVAEFADFQYQQISDYIKSDVFEEQIRVVGESKRQADFVDSSKSKRLLTNQSKIESSQVKEIRNKQERFLNLAMKFYLKVLAESDKDDLKIFRVVSFWLHNKSHVELHREIRENMFQIPSYKFVPALPQLMAHITRNVAESFGCSLNKIIAKCIEDHPHHTLPLILALANYQHERKLQPQDSAPEERILAAAAYIDKYRSHTSLSKVVYQMETLADAYIQLAYHSTKNETNPVVLIPSNYRITKIQNYNEIMCPTINVPINKNACYKDIIGIRRIEPNFVLVGGINAPKKVTCICTDGKIRNQLVKGEDDMRADAVMQQVFSIMNTLLYDNKLTSERKLYIRTYKVVPLSQRSGVLEFCDNTISLSQYLTYDGKRGNLGAHRKYRPEDMRTDQARKLLGEAKTDKDKRKRYREICEKLKPVFRYFFVEKFPSPASWFERKLAYIHSLAVMSMVGYILGIGDRHVQNMLLDETTAEIIHIDFGITFDQGLMLNTPELVPFRLTRDIEDGMGIFSVDGIFRRCCEQTLSVLRENSDIIRTTIEVFIHDPLYLWTLSSEKKASYQSGAVKNPNPGEKDVEVNFTASRALSRIKLKLQGLDEGTATTIEGQVNRLIQQAKDVNNLYKIYVGWQPYL